MPTLKYTTDGVTWNPLQSGPPGAPGGTMWVQPSQPVVEETPDGYPLWLDTDEEPPSLNLSGRNRLMNGDFSVNQRGFTSSSANAVYPADRWSLQYWAPGSASCALVQAPVNELPESAKQYLRITTANGGAGGGVYLDTRVEDARVLSGKQVTLSFWARCTTGTAKLGADWTYNYGSGGSPAIAAGTWPQVTIDTTWKRYSTTVQFLPHIGGTVFGSNHFGNLRFQISRDVWMGVQNNTFDLWGFQLEEGNVATQFEQKTYAEELRACRRYFQRIGSPINAAAAGYCASNAIGRVTIPYPVTMRSSPTVVMVVPGVVNCTASNPAPTSIGVNAAYTDVAWIDANVPAQLVAGQGCIWYNFILDFSAEL